LGFAGLLFLAWSFVASSATEAGTLKLVDGAEALSVHQSEAEFLRVAAVDGKWRLQSLPGDANPALTIPVPATQQDMSTRRQVEFTLTNSGRQGVEFTLWALSPGGWSGASTYPDNTNGRIRLQPGQGGVFPVDLWARFPGPDTFAGVVQPSQIDRLRIVLQRGRTNESQQLDLTAIRLGGAAPELQPDAARRVRVPAIVAEPPAAGRRVWRSLPEYSATKLRHVLTLPRNWRKDAQFPIIVEYTGNEFFHKFCHSTGFTEQGTMAYGLGRGEDFILLNLPFVSPDGQREQQGGWGDEAKTIDYCLAALRDGFDHFGGDSSAVILTGFSRGQIAMNCIGLRDDRIADVWLAFIGANPGKTWPGGKGWNNSHVGWDERATRLNGRSWFDEHPKFGPGVHVDVEYLEDCESTVNARRWLRQVIDARPGLQDVRGRVTTAAGQGMAGVRVESGPTRFAWTDKDGRYVLRSVVVGERTVRVRKEGVTFQPASRQITVSGGEMNEVDFQSIKSVR
jgi:hypothetical protein